MTDMWTAPWTVGKATLSSSLQRTNSTSQIMATVLSEKGSPQRVAIMLRGAGGKHSPGQHCCCMPGLFSLSDSEEDPWHRCSTSSHPHPFHWARLLALPLTYPFLQLPSPCELCSRKEFVNYSEVVPLELISMVY